MILSTWLDSLKLDEFHPSVFTPHHPTVRATSLTLTTVSLILQPGHPSTTIRQCRIMYFIPACGIFRNTERFCVEKENKISVFVDSASSRNAIAHVYPSWRTRCSSHSPMGRKVETYRFTHSSEIQPRKIRANLGMRLYHRKPGLHVNIEMELDETSDSNMVSIYMSTKKIKSYALSIARRHALGGYELLWCEGV